MAKEKFVVDVFHLKEKIDKIPPVRLIDNIHEVADVLCDAIIAIGADLEVDKADTEKLKSDLAVVMAELDTAKANIEALKAKPEPEQKPE